MSCRKALLAACLSLPMAGIGAVAHAATPRAERTIRVPAGSIVLMLPGALPTATAVSMPGFSTFPADFPVIDMMAQQDAMLQQMMHQMHLLDRLTMAMPDPAQVVRSVTDQVGHPLRLAPGSGVVTTVVSNGHGVCRQTITYRAGADGAQPLVHVMQTGDDCGALAPRGPIGVTQTVPKAPAARPETAPPAQHPRLWSVGDPPHPLTMTAPRT